SRLSVTPGLRNFDRLGHSQTRILPRRGGNKDGDRNWGQRRSRYHRSFLALRLPPARRFQPSFLLVQLGQGGRQALWRNRRGGGGGGTGRRTTKGSGGRNQRGWRR